MQNEKNESSTLSTINAFVLFAYSAWVLFYSIFFNTSQSILGCLMECNTFWRSLFDQWTMNNRAGRATTIKQKQVANEPDQSNVQPSSSSIKKRQANSWQMDTPPNKKSTTLLLPDTKLPNVRNVFVVFRAFRYNDELMGFGIWNSYVWRETIDHLYGFPANAYIRIADVLLPSTHPFVEEHEGTAYSVTNNASDLFDRLLNTARGNVSRFAGEEIITPVEVATEEV